MTVELIRTLPYHAAVDLAQAEMPVYALNHKPHLEPEKPGLPAIAPALTGAPAALDGMEDCVLVLGAAGSTPGSTGACTVSPACMTHLHECA